MNLTVEQRKKLIEIYPYLEPCNLWTGKVSEDYDYSYIRGESELPEGWFRLFLMYCKDIRIYLIESEMLYTFRFSQLKEKWGLLCLYNFGYPASMEHLTPLYESFSKEVCSRCGNFTSWKTLGWIEYLCDKCFNHLPVCGERFHRNFSTKKIKVLRDDYKNKKHVIVKYSVTPLRRKYKKVMKMTDDEFYSYITEV